jgi:two-component system, NtrC family, sensor kinase
VRWLVIGGFFSLAVLGTAVGVFPSLVPCARVAVLGSFLNAANHWCVRRGRWVGWVTALAIPGDVLFITYVIVNTGGVQSPFLMMYVVQVVTTAMLVDLVVASTGALASVACFVAASAAPSAGGLLAARELVWALFLFYCLALLAYVGGYVSEQLRGSERNLAERNRELRRTVERLRSTETQLVQSEKMRAVGQFVAGIAHELNNPIAFVAGNVDHLRRVSGALTEMLAAYAAAPIGEATHRELAERRRCLAIDDLLCDLPSVLDDCEEGARRAKQIVSALGSFARQDGGARWERADLHAGLDRSLSLLRHRIASGIRIERDYGALPPVDCLPGQLDQVFLNLLVNAVDAVGQSGTIRIRTALDAGPAPAALVSIEDDGIGIPADAVGRIFDPFFTTKEPGKGTGLGLSVSYGIVERHGGSMTVASSAGAGSVFTVRVPIHHQSPADDPVAAFHLDSRP